MGGCRVDRWVAMADRLDRQMAPITELLIAATGLRPGDRVLDVGCGTGPIARRAAEIVGPQGSVTGVDVAADMVAAARDATPEIEGSAPVRYVEADATTWSSADLFDVVISRFGVMFFDDPRGGVRQPRRPHPTVGPPQRRGVGPAGPQRPVRGAARRRRRRPDRRRARARHDAGGGWSLLAQRPRSGDRPARGRRLAGRAGGAPRRRDARRWGHGPCGRGGGRVRRRSHPQGDRRHRGRAAGRGAGRDRGRAGRSGSTPTARWSSAAGSWWSPPPADRGRPPTLRASAVEGRHRRQHRVGERRVADEQVRQVRVRVVVPQRAAVEA